MEISVVRFSRKKVRELNHDICDYFWDFYGASRFDNALFSFTLFACLK